MTSISQSSARDLPGGQTRPWLSTRQLVLLIAVGLAVVALFYRWMAKQWGPGGFSATYFEDWAHAWFVPFISAYYIWLKRRELAATPVTQFWPGLCLMMLGIVAYAFFVGGYSNHMFQGFSLVLVVAGATLLIFGPFIFEKLIFPIAFLGFAVTISERVMNSVTWPLKRIAAKGAWFLLNLFGVPTDLEGNVLKVGADAIPLDVADACSGMRMVIAFLALGFAVAFFGCRFWWQRVAIILMALPVAVFMNVIRVAVLGLLSLINPSLATGQAHMLVGNLLLIPAFFVFMFIVWALKRAVHEGPSNADKPKAKPKTAKPAIRPASISMASLLAAIAVLASSAMALGTVIRVLDLHLTKLPISPPDNAQMRTLPTEYTHWNRLGEDQVLSAEIADELGTQNYINRNYINTDDPDHPKLLQVHFAYYTGMIDTVPHVPERCMVGNGWDLTGESRIVDVPLDLSRFPIDDTLDPEEYGSVRLANGWKPLPRDLDKLRMQVTRFESRNGQVMYAGYFFFANGQHTPTADNVRLMAFRLQDDYAYYAKMQFSSFDATSPEDLAQMAASLLDEMLPDIADRIPNWVDVKQGKYPPAP